MFAISGSPLDLKTLNDSLKESKAGALVTFEGWVRNHNQGKSVESLEYQVYDTLALKEGARILAEAKEKFNLHSIACTHRFGHLAIGEVAVWVGANASHRDDAFLAARFVIDEIKLRLPIWKKEHYTDQKAEWVYCKDHHTHVHFEEADYYQKQKSVVNQARLKSKSVLVVGAGGLGSPALTALTQAGVGKIMIADFDTVDLSNLHRQLLFSTEDVGELKTVIARKKLSALNSFVAFETANGKLDANRSKELIPNYDLVLDCTDSLATKFMLHDECFRAGKPLVSASIYRYEAQLRTFIPHSESGCLRCHYTQTPRDEDIGNCNDFGVLGAAVGAIGMLQANEAIQFLSEGKNASTATTVFFNTQSLSLHHIKNRVNANCTTCKPEPTGASPDISENTWGDSWQEHASLFEVTAGELNDNFELIDLRIDGESKLERYLDSSKKIAVLCERGIRSRRVVKQLRDRGYSHFYSLSGGACSL